MRWILYDSLILCCLIVTPKEAINARVKEQDDNEGPIMCNGENAASHLESEEPFPWNAVISLKVINHVICLGSIIPDRPYNYSFAILTSGKCFSWKILDKLASFVLQVHFQTDKVGPFISSGMRSRIRKITFVNKERVISTRLTRPAILLLKRPVVFNDKAFAICTAWSSLKLQDGQLCYTSIYKEGKIIAKPMKIVTKDHCEKEDITLKRESGFCVTHEEQSHELLLGAPLVCIESGKAYQVGLYQHPLNGKTNTSTMSFFRHVVDVTLQTQKKRLSPTKPTRGQQKNYLASNLAPSSKGPKKRKELFKKRAKQAIQKMSARKKLRIAFKRKRQTKNASQKKGK